MCGGAGVGGGACVCDGGGVGVHVCVVEPGWGCMCV